MDPLIFSRNNKAKTNPLFVSDPVRNGAIRQLLITRPEDEEGGVWGLMAKVCPSSCQRARIITLALQIYAFLRAPLFSPDFGTLEICRKWERRNFHNKPNDFHEGSMRCYRAISLANFFASPFILIWLIWRVRDTSYVFQGR